MVFSELSLALRNLRRNRRRSISTLVALGIGLASILIFSGFQTNLGHTMLTAVVRNGGHLQIQHRDFFLFGGGNPTAYVVLKHEAIIAAIQSDPILKPLLAEVSPVLRFGGLAGNFDRGISRTIIGTGYVAPQFSHMRRWNEFNVPVVKPDFPLLGTANDAALVGHGVARILQICAPLKLADCPSAADALPQAATDVADSSAVLPADIAELSAIEARSRSAPGLAPGSASIEILTSSPRGAPNVSTLKVVGAEAQTFKELDEVAVILHLNQAQRLVFGRSEGHVNAIMLQFHRSADAKQAIDRISQLIRPLDPGSKLTVRSFEDLNPFYVQSEKLFDFIFGFIFVLIGGIVLFTVGNTMNTAVVERTVEIGTLRAIGLRQAGIRRLFVLEGFMLGCLGVIAGLSAAALAGELVNRSGLSWLPPGSSESLPLQLRVFGNATIVALSSVGLVVIATASAWWPAWRAANLKIVEALRHA